MATKAKEKDEATTDKGFVMENGTVIQGDVVVGLDNKLTAKEQGMKARGELDENGNPKPDERIAKAEKAADSKASAAAVESGLTDKEKATDKALEERRKVLAAAGEGSGGVRIVKTSIKLYQGWLTVSGKASTTGEEISFTYEQADPTGEEGVYHAFRSYFPAALREGMKIDPENKDDPTKRTYLEKPAAAA